ncbi:hypothetical protein ACLK2I_10520 [Escherichia coli]
MHKFTKALAAIGLAAVMSQSAMADTRSHFPGSNRSSRGSRPNGSLPIKPGRI